VARPDDDRHTIPGLDRLAAASALDAAGARESRR
jgi:hypothetical protein